MSVILDEVNRLIDSERAAAVRAYHELLRRPDAPGKGDAQRLRDCLRVLNLEPDDYGRHVNALAEYGELLELASEREKERREAALDKASRAVDAFQTGGGRDGLGAETKYRELMNAYRTARAAVQEVYGARMRLRTLQAEYPLLAGAWPDAGA